MRRQKYDTASYARVYQSSKRLTNESSEARIINEAAWRQKAAFFVEKKIKHIVFVKTNKETGGTYHDKIKNFRVTFFTDTVFCSITGRINNRAYRDSTTN